MTPIVNSAAKHNTPLITYITHRGSVLQTAMLLSFEWGYRLPVFQTSLTEKLAPYPDKEPYKQDWKRRKSRQKDQRRRKIVGRKSSNYYSSHEFPSFRLFEGVHDRKTAATASHNKLEVKPHEAVSHCQCAR